MSDSIIRIFAVEDDVALSVTMKQKLKKYDNYDLTIYNTGAEFLNNLHLNPDIITLDYNLPDISGIELLKKVKDYNSEIPVVLMSGQQDVEVVVEAYTLGAERYIVKNDRAIIELEQAYEKICKNIALRREIEALKSSVIDRNKYDNIIGESPAVMKVLKLIEKVQNTNILTLITGKSGTGKELVARALHYNSPRKKRPFIPVNVAAIPEDLIESELFGHEKGAFTGATGRRIGKFEEANKGSIFLDEIGEMDVNLQTKLLRVLQENKITRIGSNKEIDLDIRVIAATNKDLKKNVDEGKFREDLYYRIQGFLIPLPELKERGNDVIILANHFLEEFCKSNGVEQKKLSKEALKRLMEHSWPGNIRELKAVVDRAVLISDEQEISEEDLIFSD